MNITRLSDVEHRAERSVAVGTFDGVHLGHREVIKGSDSVLTFDPHPVSVVAPGHTPKLLTTLARKAELIASLGVNELIVIPFDTEFAARSANDFINDVLVGAVSATQVAIGSTSTWAPSFSRKANMLKLPSPSVVCAQNSPVILMIGFTRSRSTSMAWILSRQACSASTYSLPYRLCPTFPSVHAMPAIFSCALAALPIRCATAMKSAWRREDAPTWWPRKTAAY